MATLETGTPLASRRWKVTSVYQDAIEHGRAYGSTFLTEFAVMASQILVYKLAAHYLGRTGFSEYALARRTVSVLYPIVLLGLGIGLPRYIAHAVGRGDQDSKNRYWGATIWCVGLSALICFALMNAFPHTLAYLFFGSRDYTSLIFPLSLVVTGLALHAIVYGYFRGILAMRFANLLQFVNFCIVPLAVFFLFHNNVQSLLGALGILSLAVAGIAILFTPLAAATKNNRMQAKELLGYGIQRVPGDFVHMALFALPATFVAHTNGIKIAGFVAFGISMLNLVGSFFTPIGLILLPRAGTLLAAGENGELKRHVWLLAKITLVISGVIAMAIAVLADRLIRVYLGPDFAEAAGIVRLLLFAAVPYSLYLVLRNVIDAFHELGVTTMILCAGFVVFCSGSTALFVLQDKLHVVLVAFLSGIVTVWLLSSRETLRILRVSASAE
jgi:O-antigen/teichoic acid export membrane protein